MKLVRTKQPVRFNSDGTGNRPSFPLIAPEGTICLVTEESRGSFYLRPMFDGSNHLWSSVKEDRVDVLSEMDVVAAATAGHLDDERGPSTWIRE